MGIQIWQQGDKIKGDRFEIVQVLGGGTFGITYLAEDRQRKHKVVLKALNATQQGTKEFKDTQERFVQEGFLLRTFQHQHIVKVFEPVQVEDLWVLVMEYIPGQDLAEYVHEQGALPEAEALDYIDKVASALDCVHGQQYFHRDVKPHNIMLRATSKEPVLIDFGIAREFDASATMYLSNTMGTELYKPIEQYEKRGRFGPATDVYALAVTLFHLLTGTPPGGGSPLYTAKARSDAKRDGYGEKIDENMWKELERVGVSGQTIAAIQAGMTVEPAERPQTMAEFRELLGLLKPKLGCQPFAFEVATLLVMEGGVKIQKRPGQAMCFIENLGNGIKLEMVKIPGGRFLMGQTDAEKKELVRQVGEQKYQEWYGCELPQHWVTVPEFYLGKFPITQQQYAAIIGEHPSDFKGEDLPVENVSWLDAQKFCTQLQEKTGKVYRLPSEAEWEYACRGGTTTPFHFGETIDAEVANYYAQDWEYDDVKYSGSYGAGKLGMPLQKN